MAEVVAIAQDVQGAEVAIPWMEKAKATYRCLLDRHNAVDADKHGPMAGERVDRICGDDDLKWKKAETAARRHIETRIPLWDSALERISQSR